MGIEDINILVRCAKHGPWAPLSLARAPMLMALVPPPPVLVREGSAPWASEPTLSRR